MKINEQLSETAILAELGARLALRRLNRNLTQAQLADEAGVSKRTIERVEAGQSIQLTNFIRVLQAFGITDAMEQLIPAPVPSPIAELELQGKRRQRASGKKPRAGTRQDWTWDDDT